MHDAERRKELYGDVRKIKDNLSSNLTEQDLKYIKTRLKLYGIS